ncbi:MAG: 5-(carboxyamino)imidazole ribonucleotide mutase [Firmicutes bacterium]|jgi:5-(carboxyamino)imidazole ribonucleotide mutase|nr:5-(carboxyamino)imidazole ribonucleotide mutase [Bacillota bacterium]
MIKAGIVMGSDSDLKIMAEAARVLEHFQVGYEMVVASAHRTPEKVCRYAREAVEAGLKVIIAGAGGAAHLPGVIAALTTLPVIGVPIAIPPLGGVDSLYAIVQMPQGVPVATVSINGAHNAGLLAVQILALGDQQLAERLAAYRQELAAKVESKDRRLQETGWAAYLAEQERK